MGNFFSGLGHVLKSGFDLTDTGMRKQQLDLQKQQQRRQQEQSDIDFVQHMRDMGAIPIYPGSNAVKRDLTLPNGETIPGGLLDKAGSDGRQVVTHTGANGDKLQFELPSPDEQINFHAQRLANQFAAEGPTRQASAREAVTNASNLEAAKVAAQADAEEAARQKYGIAIPPDISKVFGIDQASGRKVLLPELSNLENVSSNIENRRMQATNAKVQQGLQALGPVTDQASYDEWRQTYPEAAQNAPSVYAPAIKDMLIRRAVPIEKQPEFDINTLTLRNLQHFDPAEMDKQIDTLGLSPQVAANTKTLARSAIARGGKKGLEDAQKIIQDAAEGIQKTETAVATAKATAPTKIEIARETAGARADAAGLTQDDYDRAGQQYAMTGTMPALGRDSVTRGRIVKAANAWAKDNGLSPKDIVQIQAAYAGDKESLKKFQAQRDQIVSFEQTAQKNLDQFLSIAAQIPDTGVPWINKPLRSLDADLVGDANMAAVNAARQVANNEIAKVTSGGGLGGVLSDAARKEVMQYNPADATFAQTKAVANVLKNDMANRHQAMDATLSEIKGRIGNPGSQQTPQAIPAGTTTMIRARDKQGKLHEAPAGTPLPEGWTLEK